MLQQTTAFLDSFRTFSSLNAEEGSPFAIELQSFLTAANERLTIESNLTGFEATLTGPYIANWIKPLHFEYNINAALDALEALENLQNEERNHLLTRLLLNFSDQYFNKKHMALLQELEPQIALTNDADILKLRLLNKFSDLVELTKAAKLGAQNLFGIDPGALEYKDTQHGIHRIRESLRLLLQKYKEFQKNDQEVIVSISLKKALKADGERLVTWAHNQSPEVQSQDGTDLGTRNIFPIPLFHYPAIANLRHQRIRRVGVQIIDSQSQEVNPPHVNIWHVTLDYFNDIALGELGEQTVFRPGAMTFNVASSKNAFGIEWSAREDIINAPANCYWGLGLEEKSHIGRSYTTIKDIILHFHLTHNGKK